MAPGKDTCDMGYPPSSPPPAAEEATGAAEATRPPPRAADCSLFNVMLPRLYYAGERPNYLIGGLLERRCASIAAQLRGWQGGRAVPAEGAEAAAAAAVALFAVDFDQIISKRPPPRAAATRRGSAHRSAGTRTRPTGRPCSPRPLLLPLRPRARRAKATSPRAALPAPTSPRSTAGSPSPRPPSATAACATCPGRTSSPRSAITRPSRRGARASPLARPPHIPGAAAGRRRLRRRELVRARRAGATSSCTTSAWCTARPPTRRAESGGTPTCWA